MANRQEEFETWLREVLRNAAPEEYAEEGVSEWKLNRLLQAYVAWCDRSIPVRTRKTTFAQTFAMPEKDADAICEIFDLSEKGADLNRYLSSHRERPPFQPHTRRNKDGKWKIDWSPRNKDRILNTYGLHHLHLKEIKPSGKRRGGSDKLLFAKVYRNELHIVHFGTHRSFEDTVIHEVAAHVALREGWVLLGVQAECRSVEDQVALSRHGGNPLTKVKEDFVWPARVSAAGTAMDQTRHVDRICLTVEEANSDFALREKLESFVQTCRLANSLSSLKWRMNWNDLVLLDEVSNRAFLTVGWRS